MKEIESVIKTLTDRRDALNEALAKAEGLRADLDKCLAGANGSANGSAKGNGDGAVAPHQIQPEQEPVVGHKSLAQNTAEVMRNRTMRATSILQELNGAGVHVGGKKPLVTLYSTLKRSPLFRRTRDGSWRTVARRSQQAEGM